MASTRVACGVVTALIALLSACATAPAPQATLLVAAIGHTGDLEKLSAQTGTVTQLLTVAGHEKWLLLEHSDNAAFVGHSFDGATGFASMGTGPIEQVPFDSIALAYYATPPHPFENAVPAELLAFPSLPTPGAVEQGATCADLDVELARAETVRWYARDQGAVPYTSGQITATHAKNAAKYTGEALLVFIALGGGGGNCCGPGQATPAVLSVEDWRWAVTGAERRVVALLELKQAKHCASRAVDGASGGDLGILEGIEGDRRERETGHINEAAQLSQETAWLDKLNPLPLGPRNAYGRIVDYGEGASQNFGNAQWLAGVDFSAHMKASKVWEGTLVLTDKSVILQEKSDKPSANPTLVRISLADMMSVEIKARLGATFVVVTQVNGHVDTFWLIHRIMGDPKGTEELGVLLKSKIPVRSTPGAGT